MPRKSANSNPPTAPMQELSTIPVATAASRLHLQTDDFRAKYLKAKYPNTYRSLKAIPEAEFEAILHSADIKSLPVSAQPQQPLPAKDSHTAELPESSVTPTEQELQPATEPANWRENTDIVAQQPQQQITNPQTPTPNNRLTLIEQLSRQATEEIAAVDAIAQVRNTLIINNLNVRDAELVEGLNQRWQGQKQEYLGAIRDLASLAQDRVEITPDEIDLPQEIDSIITELGKKLSA